MAPFSRASSDVRKTRNPGNASESKQRQLIPKCLRDGNPVLRSQKRIGDTEKKNFMLEACGCASAMLSDLPPRIKQMQNVPRKLAHPLDSRSQNLT